MRGILGLIVTLMWLLPVEALAERRVAFVLGNSVYDHAPNLPNPVNDAALIAETLDSLSFEVTRHDDLTVREIAQALGAFLRDTDGADVTLFYFAGHGMQFEGKNFLLGRDSRFQTVFDLRASALELDTVLTELERNSRAALVFVDACRNNPIADAFFRDLPGETRALTARGLAPLAGDFDGTMVTFAASPGQVAYDGDGWNSPFAKALARHLPTANREVLSLMKRVIGDVRSETGGRQTPMVVNDLAAEVYLREVAVTTAPSEAQLAAEALRAARALSSPEARAEALADVVERFPGTVSAELAAILLKPVPEGSAAALPDPDPLPAPAADPAAAEARLALDRQAIRQLQAALLELGHDAGPTDGVLGGMTRLAIREFQRAAAEVDHGYATPRLLVLLEQARGQIFAAWNGTYELTWYRRIFTGGGGINGTGAIVAKADLRIENGEVSLERFVDLTRAAREFSPNLSATLSARGQLQVSATVNYIPFKSRLRVVFLAFDLPADMAASQSVSITGSQLDARTRIEATLFRHTVEE